MLAKGMHLIEQIEFENCIFFQLLTGELPLGSFWEGTPSQTAHFFNGQRFLKVLAKASKTGKVEGTWDMLM